MAETIVKLLFPAGQKTFAKKLTAENNADPSVFTCIMFVNKNAL